VAGEKILVIDDNQENVQFMVDYLLQPSGYVPIVASNGRQGLESALLQRPDLIILDFKLPEMSGLDVLRALRRAQNDIPVIFMTAFGSEDDIIASFRLGIKDYFSKPFEIQEMMSTIERVLGEKRQAELRALRQHELEECVKELGTLYGTSLERVLNRIVESAVAITDAEEGYLLLVDQNTNELYMRSALNVGERFARGFRLRIEDSLTGRVVRTGQPVRYNYLDDDRFKVKTGYLVKSLLNIPLRVRDRVIGVLGVDNKHAARIFTRADQELLMALGEHAATAIENASLYERTQQLLMRQVQELSAIEEVARDLNGIMDLDRIASSVLNCALRMTGADAGLIGLRTDKGIRWSPRGYLAPAMESGVWQPHWEEGIIGKCVRLRAPLTVQDTRQDEEALGCVAESRSILLVPVLRGEEVIGVIDLESVRPRVFQQDGERFLLALAHQAAIAVENTRLFDVVVGEQSKNRLILDSIADGVYTVDHNLRILTFNPAAERITGWRETEVRGKLCEQVFRDANPEGGSHQASLIGQVLRTGQPITSRPDAPALYGRDGRQVFVSSSVAPLRNRENQVVGGVVAFRDVSVEREFERLKSDFVSMVSHELRTPLANLSAAIELLLSGLTDGSAGRRTLSIARANAQRLQYLIDDILSVSQIDAGKMKVQREPLTVIPIVRRAIRTAQTQSDRHRITLAAPPSVPFVMADQSKLEIVLSNLLTNAINYSPDGGRIVVRIESGSGDSIEICVIDEGMGIAQEHLDRIFEPFYQVDTSDQRKVYGHGLGLYISKRLVELQGGRIWVKSKVGRGSCFGFSLPIVQESEIAEEHITV